MTKSRVVLLISWTCLTLLAGNLQGSSKTTDRLDARGVMQKTEEAVRRIKSIEYRFVQRGHGDGPEKPSKMEGRVVLSGPVKNMWVEKFRVEAKVQSPGEGEPMMLWAGTDGQLVYLADSKEKKVYADIDPGVLGSKMFTVLETVISNLVSSDPFEYEKKAEQIELKEDTKIGDFDCHALRFQFSGTNEIVWFVDHSDGLPRRIDWIFKGPNGEVFGASTLLQDLIVNPSFTTDPFKLVVPEGFTTTDSFAP